MYYSTDGMQMKDELKVLAERRWQNEIEVFWGRDFPLTAQPKQILRGLDLKKAGLCWRKLLLIKNEVSYQEIYSPRCFSLLYTQDIICIRLYWKGECRNFLAFKLKRAVQVTENYGSIWRFSLPLCNGSNHK